jgi:alpha/beta superfamily hydrolase
VPSSSANMSTEFWNDSSHFNFHYKKPFIKDWCTKYLTLRNLHS